jgi:hypothetical protein
MKPYTIILMWLAVWIAFTTYGFLGPGMAYQPGAGSGLPFDWKAALEPTIAFSAIGLCFGAYLSIGLVFLKLVRRERLYRVWAVLLLAFLGLLLIPGPTGIVFLVERATISGSRLYQKELFYFPNMALYVMLWAVSGIFLILAICISCVTSCPLLTRSLHSTPR